MIIHNQRMKLELTSVHTKRALSFFSCIQSNYYYNTVTIITVRHNVTLIYSYKYLILNIESFFSSTVESVGRVLHTIASDAMVIRPIYHVEIVVLRSNNSSHSVRQNSKNYEIFVISITFVKL